jgi:murein DD-endopeptidase MepM/ murein hydrolase activator NlpD
MLLLLATLLQGPSAPTAPGAPVVELLPAPLYRVSVGGMWSVEADLRITNPGSDTTTLTRITLRVLGPAGEILLERYAGGNGGVRVALLDPAIPPGATRLAFNPFNLLPATPAPVRLRFELIFEHGRGARDSASVEAQTSPWTQPVKLRLPLAGRLIIPNGGELLSHHRRLDYTDPYARALGVETNFMRYALDFMPVNPAGEMFRDSGNANEDWYGWGAPVESPGEGVVVSAVDGQPDNDQIGSENRFDPTQLPGNAMTLYGNHVVIAHGPGLYSVFGHLKMGSVRVGTGQRVKAGTLLGQLGNSGTSTRPHLHYELRTGPGIVAEGLPVEFRRYRRWAGDVAQRIPQGHPYSGDIVERE